MSPTLKPLAAITAWGLLGLAASIWPGLMAAWWIAGALLAAILAVDAGLLLGSARLSIRRTLPPQFAQGEPGEVELAVDPVARRLEVEIFDGIPDGAEAEAMPWRGVIPAGDRASIIHPVKIFDRGLAAFGPVSARVRSPLGWWRRTTKHGAPETVKVYPNYEPVVRFALLATQARQEQMGIQRRPVGGSSRDFHQLRDYREGDPLSQIDWKASSRHRALISREFREQRNQRVIFLADTGRRMRAIDGDLPQFDHCLNAMLLLSYVALRQGDWVGVQSFGGTDRWLPAVKGAHSMTRILNHLFDYRTTAAPSDFTAAAERFQTRERRRALVIVLTNLRGEDAAELTPALNTLALRHLVVLASLRERVIEDARTRPVEGFDDALRFAAAEQADRERREIMAGLRAAGILTLDVPANQFPVALANRYLDIKAAGRL